MNQVTKWWPLLLRCLLYFSIPFLLFMSEKLSPFADKDLWPTAIKWVLWVVAGTCQGLIALRAYLDGSAQRITDQIKTNGNGPKPAEEAPKGQ